ncbi:prepilin-type N-terminal cleavage/methylation domain-containing protein [Demequina aurantiaca]|uniref:prepilin-type N-terminal cleavage/methylation domain-containing protein n=1 Tax=Demequina aurantiaca TaxID=676200 RepID=UPI000A02FD0B|nr:prepilin-type N-terminal cleavage/methylation domain-containing protein [Demequina aurantiaca]
MIARIQKHLAAKEEGEKGFTLIELLVVIIIIGILAAIAIPVFLNQRKKAVDTGIKSDLRTIATELESSYVDNQAYPAEADVDLTTQPMDIDGVDVTMSNDGNDYTYTNNTDSFVVTGTNPDDGTGLTFTYDSANGGLSPEGS